MHCLKIFVKNIKKYLFFSYAYKCFALYICVCTMCMFVPLEAGTVLRGDYELPCGCWESNPGPLQEQGVILTGKLSLSLCTL